MATVELKRATLDDLYLEPGKAELIGGRIVRYMASGFKPSKVALRIATNFDAYAKHVKKGDAFANNLGYAVKELSSGRESFSPDASYYDGPLPKNLMRFVEGAPKVAAEVRRENDYTRAAEIASAKKRADYFEAGTQVVWDVDPVAECVHVYRATQPDRPATYRRGEMAEAEPAMPGWRVGVDEIFA